MLPICRSYLRADLEDLSESDLYRVGDSVYDATEVAGAQFVELPGLGSRVEVEEGSLTVAGIIVIAPAVLYAAVASYGSFWSGIEKIIQHAQKAGAFIRDRVRTGTALEHSRIRGTRITTGHLAKLERLRREVALGRRDPNDAVQDVLKTLSDAGDAVDGNMVSAIEAAFQAPEIGPERLRSLERRDAMLGYGGGPAERREAIVERGRGRRRLTIERRPMSLRRVVTVELLT